MSRLAAEQTAAHTADHAVDVAVPTPAEADARLAEAAALPGAAELLDASTLSELLGRSVEIRRLRLKPGSSLAAGLVDDRGRHGWALLTRDDDKIAAARRRAARHGGGFAHRGLHGSRLLSGDLINDPELAKELGVARDGMPGLTAHILRYNPRRRVVGLDAEQSMVVRVAAERQDHLVAAAGRWRAVGVPVLDHQVVGRRGTAVASPLWGAGDLLAPSTTVTAEALVAAAASAGEAIGRLHRRTLRRPSPDGASTVRRLDPAAGAAAEALALPAPWLAAEATDLARRLTPMLPDGGADAAETAQLHGDLSPDQVLIDDAGTSTPDIRLIDLDRCGTGDPMRDVGSWLASCHRLALPRLQEAFLDGYAAEAPLDPTRLAAWEAHAHLEAAVDPFRRREHDWPQAMRRTLDHARRALDGATDGAGA